MHFVKNLHVHADVAENDRHISCDMSQKSLQSTYIKLKDPNNAAISLSTILGALYLTEGKLGTGG